MKQITEDQINEAAFNYKNNLSRADQFPLSESLQLAYKTGFQDAIKQAQPETSFIDFLKSVDIDQDHRYTTYGLYKDWVSHQEKQQKGCPWHP